MQRPSLLAIIFLVAGCASAPPVAIPELDVTVPGTWTATSVPAGQVSIDWWTDFADDGLSQAVETALTRNFDLQAAAARLEIAAADARIAASGLQPSVEAGYSGSRRKRSIRSLT